MTHMLVTERGIACVMEKDKNPVFVPKKNWGFGYLKGTLSFIAYIRGNKGIIDNYFIHYHDEKYETKDSFERRIKTFPFIIWPLRIKDAIKDLSDPNREWKKKAKKKQEEYILHHKQWFKDYAHSLGVEITDPTKIPFDKIIY